MAANGWITFKAISAGAIPCRIRNANVSLTDTKVILVAASIAKLNDRNFHTLNIGARSNTLAYAIISVESL